MIPPAQLFIGPHKTVLEKTKSVLQKLFCNNGACATCITCKQVEEEQHHAVLWIEPEKQYTLETIAPIFQQITFALEPGQHAFFVLKKADFLTAACSNSLLKSVEEPPPGYHFIFLAQRGQQILPTIRSRCVTTSFWTGATSESQDFVDMFKKKLTCMPSVFLKLLSQKNPSERETIELLDNLLVHWIAEHKKLTQEKKETVFAHSMVKLLKKSLEQPPMPGSSKIFWRNLYLQFSKNPS